MLSSTCSTGVSRVGGTRSVGTAPHAGMSKVHLRALLESYPPFEAQEPEQLSGVAVAGEEAGDGKRLARLVASKHMPTGNFFGDVPPFSSATFASNRAAPPQEEAAPPELVLPQFPYPWTCPDEVGDRDTGRSVAKMVSKGRTPSGSFFTS